MMRVQSKAVTFDLWFTLIWLDEGLLRKYIDGRYSIIRKYLRMGGVGERDIREAFEKIYPYRMVWRPEKLLSELIKVSRATLREEDFKSFLEEYLSFHDSMEPYLNPEAPETLSYLKKGGYRVGIISNTSFPETSVWRMLSRLGLSSYIDVITCSCDVEVMKPNPEIFRITLHRLRVNVDEAAHVGDNYDDDVVGARSVGITPILYRGLWDKYDSYPPARSWRKYDKDKSIIIISDLRELKDIF
jgi:HAD superfamily hydrolase (TIGR01549 family)